MLPTKRSFACAAAVACLLFPTEALAESPPRRNNWAVIVGASRYFYNYRHTSNALSFYHILRKFGLPDDRIILMLADDVACNSRNSNPGHVFNDRQRQLDLYGNSVEVDFRGEDVTVDNFLRLLTGRQPPWTPLSKRLLSDSNSNVLIYLTGHGGDEFIKFQDWETIAAEDIARALRQMYKQNRYRRVLFVADSCQAATMSAKLSSPNIVGVGCSKKGQNSYAHHEDGDVGVAVIDRFTYYAMRYLEGSDLTQSNATLQDFMDYFNPDLVMSEPEARSDLSDIPLSGISVAEFFSTGGAGAEIKFVGSQDNEKFPLSWD